MFALKRILYPKQKKRLRRSHWLPTKKKKTQKIQQAIECLLEGGCGVGEVPFQQRMERTKKKTLVKV